MKPVQLLTLLPRRPTEFFDRAVAGLELRLEPYVRGRPSYSTSELSDALSRIGRLLGADMDSVMREDGLGEIESDVKAGLRTMPQDAPFPSFHNGDYSLARMAYALVRALKPEVVVETGVCYGVTSAFILKAMERNGLGILNSIDLPPLGRNSEEFVGWLVPKDLRSRWRLSLGTSRRWLPRILKELRQIDMFLHDSLHTYGNISNELRIITPNLRRRSAVVADDIEGNSAFLEWVAECKPTYEAAIAEEAKNSVLGVGVFAAGN